MSITLSAARSSFAGHSSCAALACPIRRRHAVGITQHIGCVDILAKNSVCPDNFSYRTGSANHHAADLRQPVELMRIDQALIDKANRLDVWCVGYLFNSDAQGTNTRPLYEN